MKRDRADGVYTLHLVCYIATREIEVAKIGRDIDGLFSYRVYEEIR